MLKQIFLYDRLCTSFFFMKRFGIGLNSLMVLFHYVFRLRFQRHPDEKKLRAVIDWLKFAQDKCNGDGIASVFYIKTGWGVAYPETSGYILSTYLAYDRFSGGQDLLNRAKKIGDWELVIQAKNGGVISSPILKQTRIFNTGQVILGLLDLYETTCEIKYLNAAKRAGEYLILLQDPDGAWRRDTYCGARTYHARVSWSLLRLARLTGDVRFADAAKSNLKWVLAQQKKNGWFHNCGFNSDLPITHVISYTLCGLLESSECSPEVAAELDLLKFLDLSVQALYKAISNHSVRNIDGMVPSSFDENWVGTLDSSCLTGNVQIACLFYRYAVTRGDLKFKKMADRIVDATSAMQIIDTQLLDIKGAIPGSFPFGVGYIANGYPNWAAKYFADALMMKINFDQNFRVKA